MNLKPYFLCSIVILISSQLCHAQHITTNLTHYIFPEFVDGTILERNGRKNHVTINYNSLSEEMVFQKGDSKFALGKTEMERVDTIFIEDKKFVNLDGQFVEVLYRSVKMVLYVQYKCKLREPGKNVGYGGTSEVAAVDRYSSQFTGRNFYEIKLPKGYSTTPLYVYYLMKNGIVSEALNLNQLSKLFENQEDEFKDYVKTNKVKFDNIDKVTGLIEFLDNTN
ncbi:MAG: hypothetical protein ACFHWX_07455 [Bacteroidota bacterium]